MKCSQELSELLDAGDALIIVPPFAQIKYAHLGAHMLQACAREAGFDVRVLYANLLWASEIGCDRYELFLSQGEILLGERSFARAAFGAAPWGRNADQMFTELAQLDSTGKQGMGASRLTPEAIAGLSDLEEKIPHWADMVAEVIAGFSYPIVGATTSVEQTASSIAVLKRVKALQPDATIIIGGANCDGPMANEIAALDPAIDYVFSGECDNLFPEFLKQYFAGNLPDDRVLRADPVSFMDGLPLPNFDEYFQQYEFCLSSRGMAPEPQLIPYETSRGCWWGQKHHCTFCGINGSGMGYRDKSPDRALSDMRQLRDSYGNLRFMLSDAIMPWSYRKTLLPELVAEEPRFKLAYEEKANLKLKDVVLLKNAGVDWIVPGIEALSSNLLKLMKKGVLGRQNIALLRYARLCQMNVGWSLLMAFPGDELEDYEMTLEMLPLLHHLQAPKGIFPFMLARFSPYFTEPENHGISAIRPLKSYADIFPDHVDLMNLAYHFDADYDTGYRRYPELWRKLEAAVAAWQQCWNSGVRSTVILRAARLDNELVMIRDTRGIDGTEEYNVIGRDKAIKVLAQQKYDPDSEIQAWAVERRLGLFLDNCYVPLATASSEFLLEIEAAATENQSNALDVPAFA